MNELPFPDRTAGWDLESIKLIVWGPKSGLSVHSIPWLGEA